MALPLGRRPEPGDESAQAITVTTFSQPAFDPGVVAQGAATLGLLAGLWVAISPLFLLLQHVGNNANTANVIVGLVIAGAAAFALAGQRGFAALQFGTLLLGVWVIISSFILDAKFAIAAPMYWSNSFAGGVLVVLALAGLAAARRAAA